MKCGNALYLPAELARQIGGEDPFESIMRLQGTIFRDVPGRRTLRFDLAGKSYFAKLHFGAGWREIFKNLLSLRMPILSAETEWHAIQRLNTIGIPTTPGVGFGCKGHNPARLRSFLITEDLGEIVSLEDHCRDWLENPPSPAHKRKLLTAVADIACRLHANGMNHRDFYLCHFCLDKQKLATGEIHLYLIDLHRMQIRHATPRRWRNKDLAALYFSALEIGLDRRDRLRFLRHYFRQPLHQTLRQEASLLGWLENESARLLQKFRRKYVPGTAS